MLNKRILVLIFLLVFLPLVGCLPSPVPSNQAPIIISIPITAVTVGETYVYNVEATDPDGDILTYSLITKPMGMTINPATGSIKWTPKTEGNYAVVVKVSDGDFYIIQSFTIVVSESPVVNQTPVASFTASPTSGVLHLEVFFNASGSYDPDGNILSYEWDFKDGNVGSGKIINHTFTSTGNYDVKLTVTGNEGATDSVTKSITVTYPITSNQSPIASFTANPTSGDAPLVVFFSASNSYDSDGTIISYAWDFKDGNAGNGETISHTFVSAGSYNVGLTITDNEGATDSTTKTITVTETNFNNLDYLEGAIIIANDNEYLGKISKSQFDSDSINNQFGTYGSQFSAYSIFNNFGTYGSEFSSLSPFNKFTSTPPKIYKENIFIAYLTVNTFMFPRVDTNLLVVWLNE